MGSAIGNRTSCYSVTHGEDLYVFDAGSGLLDLSIAQRTDERLDDVKRVHVFVTHAHWDHWEGLKDAEWLWRKNNGIELSILAPEEAIDAIESACKPPSFVKLAILAIGTVKSFRISPLVANQEVALPSAKLLPVPLHHYSGIAPNQEYLCTLGYRLQLEGGPTIVYLCDHEPTAKTVDVEETALASADLAIVDASYGDISEHAFGHGSIESAASLSKRFPNMRILAAHHGAMREDADIEDAMRRHGAGLPNLSLAIEGSEAVWNPQTGRFDTTP